MTKINVAIIGSGNIGMDLIYKIKRSNVLRCEWIVGRDPNSVNLNKLRKMGYQTSSDGIKTLASNPYNYDIVFDATTAQAHKAHAPILYRLGKYTIDLTPARIGEICVPCLNGESCLNCNNINMVTCGGQATVPLAYAISKVTPNIKYIEMVSTISSFSAGKGTRDNIDEYIHTTNSALRKFTGINNVKAMMVLNPADPPITMRNTLYVEADKFDVHEVYKSIVWIADRIKQYVPGYKILFEPTMLTDTILTVSAQVEGSGDYLPRYAGNLDIITCAAIEMAEKKAREILLKEGATPF